MLQQQSQRVPARVVAKAWADEGFKARLLADPATVLRAEGLAVPAGIALTVVEDTPSRQTLVLPPRPADMWDEDSESLSGGCQGCVTFLCMRF